MEVQNSNVQQRIYKSLTRGYEWLYKKAIHSGNWEEVRCTSLAGICLRLREPIESPWLTAAKNWLLEKQINISPDKATWGEEIWDTAMALISLSKFGLTISDPHIQKTLNWIQSLFNKSGHLNWHDEPWETSWSVLAILEIDPDSDVAYTAAKWLLSLQNKDGKIISPHYTAYFILIGHKLKVRQEDRNEFNAATMKASEYLLNTIQDKILWTGEAWSNGQILWALAESNMFPCNNNDVLLKVVDWFTNNQEKEGNWSDVEDTASSILGLYYLLRELESKYFSSESELDNTLYHALRRNLNSPKLQIKLKLIENHEDGTTSINLSRKTKNIFMIMVGIATALAAFITLWDSILKLLRV